MGYVSQRGGGSPGARPKAYVSPSAHRAPPFSSSPSRDGFSGTAPPAPGAVLSMALSGAEVSATMTGILRAMSTSVFPGRGNADPELARVEQALLARWPENRLEPSLTRISAL